jgi:hypothetical protein
MRVGLVVLGLALGAATGCSREPEMIPVTGTVTIDGKPASGVEVNFWPTTAVRPETISYRFGRGVTGPDGRYELQSGQGKAIEAGDYRVTFSRVVAGGKVVADPKKKVDKGGARQSLPPHYTDREQTKVTAEVTKDHNTFVFDLSSK